MTVAVIAQGLFSFNEAQFRFWENMSYVGSAFIPPSLIILGKVYARPDKAFSKKQTCYSLFLL
jgi:hypothetical protein